MSLLLSPLLKYLCGGLAFVVIILGIGLKLERVHSHKLEGRVAELTATLKRISTKRDEQKVVTGGNIVKAESGRVKAEGVAKRIEQAAVVAGCKTPPEIMGADL